jgi:hypothetical protein
LSGAAKVSPRWMHSSTSYFGSSSSYWTNSSRPAATEIVDREDRLEDLLQTGVQAHIRVNAHLQERLVGGALHVDEVGHRRHFGQAARKTAGCACAGERLRDSVHACPASRTCR